MSEELKLCVNCKHLLGKRSNLEDAAEKWKCYHPLNIATSKTNLVTGEVTTVCISSISLLRSVDLALCSPSGKLFERYEPPAPYEATTRPTSKPAGTVGNRVNLDDI